MTTIPECVNCDTPSSTTRYEVHLMNEENVIVCDFKFLCPTCLLHYLDLWGKDSKYVVAKRVN